MWISKAKLDAMEKRIKALEDRPAEREREDSFTVYKKCTREDYILSYRQIPRTKISIKDVIEKILVKLGMELTYVEGSPERVEMNKAKKAA